MVKLVSDKFEPTKAKKLHEYVETVAIGEYHYIFCAVMARKQLRLLYGKMFLARLPGREVSWRIFHIAKAQKESIRFAL